MKQWYCGMLVVAAVGVMGLVYTATSAAPPRVSVGTDVVAEKSALGLKPVETNMHEFMEYAFQEPYKRLKNSLAKEPANGRAWKGVKSDGLILAEGGNLLMMRGPKAHRDAWTKHAAAVRERGGKLYQSSRKRDYAAARQHYTAMLVSCNACHQQFADGKHQLKP